MTLHPGRENRVTASFVPKLMQGDEPAIYREWQRLCGDPTYAPENLDDVWPVQFGKYIETFAVDWHERKTGRALIRRQEFLIHPQRDYVSCTLDAYRADDAAVIDCKAPGAHRKIGDVLSLYVPQMVVQRACAGAERAALLIVHGGSEPSEYAVTIPDDYEAEVWSRIDAFWRCVETLTPPVSGPAIAAPASALRDYDLAGNNEWADSAATWLENIAGKKAADAAEKALKAKVPTDAARCFGHGVVIARDRANRLTVRKSA